MATSSASKLTELLPDQEETLKQMQTILDQASEGNLDKPNNKKGFLNIHHGALIAMPDDYDVVCENIYLGGEKLARDIEGLKEKGITHVVNCAQGKKFGQVNTTAEFYEGTDISYMGIPGHDSIKYDISVHFHDAASFIEEGVKQGGVYVHCHQGISRSTAIVIAYMMIKHNITAVNAIQQILKSRCVRPNNGFLKRLAIFQSTLNG